MARKSWLSNHHHHSLVLIIIILLIMLILFSKKLDENGLVEENEELFPEETTITGNVIKLDHGGIDIQNVGQGTLIIDVSMPMQRINPSGDLDKVVIFSSDFMEHMVISYDISDSTFHAGVPLMNSPPVTLFDGKMHQIAYTYHKDRGQALYLDGKVIAFGKYSGIRASKNLVTGFVVKRGDIPSIRTDTVYSISPDYMELSEYKYD